MGTPHHALQFPVFLCASVIFRGFYLLRSLLTFTRNYVPLRKDQNSFRRPRRADTYLIGFSVP